MSKPLARDTASRTNAWPKRVVRFPGGTRAFPRYVPARSAVQRCELGSRSDGVWARGGEQPAQAGRERPRSAILHFWVTLNAFRVPPAIFHANVPGRSLRNPLAALYKAVFNKFSNAEIRNVNI